LFKAFKFHYDLIPDIIIRLIEMSKPYKLMGDSFGKIYQNFDFLK